jgi:L-gulonate 5-dehydrogenase
MKAAVTLAPHHIEIVERPEPVAGPGEALIRVERIGICGSDVHFYHGTHPYRSYPRTQGHEVAGTVLAYGQETHGPVAIGERVAIEPTLTCGTCYPCRQGRSNCCVDLKVLGAHVDGALTELIALPTTTLYATGDLDPELAALVEPVSIGVQAVARGEIGPGDTVVVFGAGPIGQAVLLATVDRGARALVVDKLASRLALAQTLGAERTVEVGREDVAAVVAEWTAGDGPAVTVDAVGAPAVIRSCIDLVASAGRVVIVGLSSEEVSIPVIQFTRKELTIVGSRNNAGRFGDAVALVRRHRDTIGAMITHRYPLEQTPAAIEFAAEHPAEAEKVMITIAR